MKVGISIPSYYKEFLGKIANLNNISSTKVCSLIVENFLSYNLKQKKFPLFRNHVSIVFENETVSQRSSDTSSCSSGNSNPNQDSQQPSVPRSMILEQLESIPEDPEDSGLPFEYESED